MSLWQKCDILTWPYSRLILRFRSIYQCSTSYSVTRSVLKMLIALGQAVAIVTTLLPFVESLIHKTGVYSESYNNHFLEIHEGE